MAFLFRGMNIQTLKRDLTLRFVLLLSVFMILLATAYYFSSRIIAEKEFDNVVLNLAGRQRALIRQYVSEANQVLVGLATSDFEMVLFEKNKADKTSKLFESTHRAFVRGGKVVTSFPVQYEHEHEHNNLAGKVEGGYIMIPPQKNSEILRHLYNVDKEWEELKRIVLLSFRSESHSISNSPYVRKLLEQATKAVVNADYVMHLIQYESELKLRKLSTILLYMVSIGSILFLIIIYFVYFRIVSPLDSSIKNLQETTDTLEVEKIKAEKASLAKSEFLSHMSHELRTPMNAILGFGQLLELKPEELNKTQQDNVNEIMSAGHHLLDLINEILDLAKIESGKMEVSLEDVFIEDLLQQCLVLIAVQAKSRQIEVIDNISNNGHVLWADFTRLKQVLLNLLSNAVKYNSEHGCITLDSKVVDGNRLRIFITDTGEGLTEEEISQLFMPFDRLNTDCNVEGTGIGLVISKHLIELMGGAVGVDSKRGEGSRFWIELPVSCN